MTRRHSALRQAQGPAEPRDLGFISPVVARLAKDKQVDLNQVKGSGQGGRITKKDVLDFLAAGQPTLRQAQGPVGHCDQLGFDRLSHRNSGPVGNTR